MANRIYHLDSSSLEAYELVKAEGPINCIVTDPPFGMKYVSNRAVTPEGKAKNNAIIDDDDLEHALSLFHCLIDMYEDLFADECEVYVFSAWHVGDQWMSFLKEAFKPHGFELKMQLIWDKGYPGQGDLAGNWGCGYEVIYYLKRGRRPLPFRRSGIIHVDKIAAGKNIHPTEKPVELLEKLVKMSTDPGDLVVDWFSGSGSTSVAAQNLGRRSIAFEKDERYIAKSQKRLEQMGFDFA